MKKCTVLSLSLKLIYACVFNLLLFSSCNTTNQERGLSASNVAAYIYPVSGINLDGDLADWPDDMIRYPIQNLELGDSLSNKADYSGNFRIGYDLKQNAIFVGVVVDDQSIVIDSTGSGNWNTQDGMELYMDEAHMKSGSPVTQYSEYGNERMTFGGGQGWDNIEMEKQVTATGRIFEWRINLSKPLAVGQAIGMDLAVTDMDDDNTFSWISWTRGTQKVSNPERCGTVVLATPGTKTHAINGKLNLNALGSRRLPISVRISDTSNPKMWLQAVADSLGNYGFSVPAGEYSIEVQAKLVSNEYNFYRIAPGDPRTIRVEKNNENKIPALVVEMEPEPDFWSEKGLLHNFGTEQEDIVDQFIRAYQDYYDIPGVSLALLKDGELAYHKTYGVKNTETNMPVNDKTLFEAASITKPVFAFVVLRLAEKGIIDLDKPLYQYLAFNALEDFPEYKKMTARHVLIHRSGLPNWGQKMENTPGEKYGYSGEGFEYLKRVVVEVMNKDIEQILDEELINPFGLYHMEFSDSPELREVVATGHLGGKPTNWSIPREAGMAFSMHTEAKSFAKFATTLFEQKGLTSDTYKDFMTIHTESNREFWNNEDKAEGAGLGIFIRKSDFGDTFYHGGNNGDFKCMFEVYKDLGMGYVIYTNSDTGSELANDIVYLLVEGNKPKKR